LNAKLLLLILLSLSKGIFAQSRLFTFPDTLNKKRLHWYIGTTTIATVGAFTGLQTLWYKDIPKSNFHFIDDLAEWNQMDKTGHFGGAFTITQTAYNMHKWCGVKDKKAIVYAGLLGFGLQSSLEIFDGFSTKWGASMSDIGFNAAGSLFFVGQQLLWNQQRILIKYSFNNGLETNDPILQARQKSLYGTSLIERSIKDYNGINLWLTVTPADFHPHPKKFQWLSIAVGYGAGGMYGGFENKWKVTINGVDSIIDYTQNTERYRRFMIAPDINFERIKTKKKGWKAVLYVLNYMKTPSPALEINTKGEVIFYPIYTFGFDFPIRLN
jgi:hypothetical protein